MEKKIHEKKIEHLTLVFKNPEKAIRAFVMLRSMKARETLIAAYYDGKVKRCCVRYMCCNRKKYQRRM